MQEEQFSPQQSLQLIQSMISKTRQTMSDNSIYFLVWGWLSFFASMGQFVLKNIVKYEQHYLVWSVVIIGIIFTLSRSRKEEKNRRVKTFVDESMGHLWLGMAVSFLVLSMILTKLGWGTVVFPFFIMLYGLGTFVSGSILRFRPLIAGGILAWILAIAATWFSYDYQMLFGAASILVSYIVPAYMLRRRNKFETA